jgi:hypothetical protein
VNTFPIHIECSQCRRIFELPAPEGFDAFTVLRHYPELTGNKCPACYKTQKEKGGVDERNRQDK